jgi:hypothetical protein
VSERPNPDDVKRCGHHETILTEIEGHGLRCPWCFPEFFPEHRFLVEFGKAERFVAAAGYRIVPDEQPATDGDAALLKDFLLRITQRSPETLADALEAVDRLAAARPAADDDAVREVRELVEHMRNDLPGWLDLLDKWAAPRLGRTPGTEIQDDMRRAADLLAAAYLGDGER